MEQCEAIEESFVEFASKMKTKAVFYQKITAKKPNCSNNEDFSWLLMLELKW
jgi:hypothetical protein